MKGKIRVFGTAFCASVLLSGIFVPSVASAATNGEVTGASLADIQTQQQEALAEIERLTQEDWQDIVDTTVTKDSLQENIENISDETIEKALSAENQEKLANEMAISAEDLQGAFEKVDVAEMKNNMKAQDVKEVNKQLSPAMLKSVEKAMNNADTSSLEPAELARYNELTADGLAANFATLTQAEYETLIDSLDEQMFSDLAAEMTVDINKENADDVLYHELSEESTAELASTLTPATVKNALEENMTEETVTSLKNELANVELAEMKEALKEQVTSSSSTESEQKLQEILTRAFIKDHKSEDIQALLSALITGTITGIGISTILVTIISGITLTILLILAGIFALSVLIAVAVTAVSLLGLVLAIIVGIIAAIVVAVIGAVLLVIGALVIATAVVVSIIAVITTFVLTIGGALISANQKYNKTLYFSYNRTQDERVDYVREFEVKAGRTYQIYLRGEQLAGGLVENYGTIAYALSGNPSLPTGYQAIEGIELISDGVGTLSMSAGKSITFKATQDRTVYLTTKITGVTFKASVNSEQNGEKFVWKLSSQQTSGKTKTVSDMGATPQLALMP